MSTQVRVKNGDKAVLKNLANQTGLSMSQVISKSLECFRRAVFFEQAAREIAEIRKDKTAFAELKEERQEWDATLSDGLDRA